MDQIDVLGQKSNCVVRIQISNNFNTSPIVVVFTLLVRVTINRNLAGGIISKK